MTVEIELPVELARLLREEAEKRGQQVSDFVRPALEGLVAPTDEATVSPGTASPDAKRRHLAETEAVAAGTQQRVPEGSTSGVELSTQSSVPEQAASERMPEGRSIHDVLDEICRSIPESEWTKLPPDLSENLDHYIYGTKKRR